MLMWFGRRRPWLVVEGRRVCGGGGEDGGVKEEGGGGRERRIGRLVRGVEEMIPFVWVLRGVLECGFGDFVIEGDEVFCFFIFWMQCTF
jgi:hypothetical protein